MGTVIGPVLGGTSSNPPPPVSAVADQSPLLCEPRSAPRSGFVGEFFGWRAIFWSLAIAAATLIVVVWRLILKGAFTPAPSLDCSLTGA